jgi:hypothetical protein
LEDQKEIWSKISKWLNEVKMFEVLDDGKFAAKKKKFEKLKFLFQG